MYRHRAISPYGSMYIPCVFTYTYSHITVHTCPMNYEYIGHRGSIRMADASILPLQAVCICVGLCARTRLYTYVYMYVCVGAVYVWHRQYRGICHTYTAPMSEVFIIHRTCMYSYVAVCVYEYTCIRPVGAI